MQVIAWSQHPKPELTEELGLRYVERDELLREADVVSLHVRLAPETNHMIGRDELAMMKPTAILINTARGACIDEAALVAALQSGQIAGAGLDVFEQEPIPADHPLLRAPNVVVTPHSAGVTPDALLAGLEMTVQNVADFLAGQPNPAYIVAGPGK
jgi:phosphoglycerate dehydrogenase-like enzyme